jgi:hypothetical protein
MAKQPESLSYKTALPVDAQIINPYPGSLEIFCQSRWPCHWYEKKEIQNSVYTDVFPNVQH